MTLEMETKQLSSGLAVLSIGGRITAATALELKNKIKELLTQENKNIILDLQQTTFIDSSGLSAIVSALKQVREVGGSLKLAHLSYEVQSIFRLTLLDRVFEMYTTVEEACIGLQ